MSKASEHKRDVRVQRQRVYRAVCERDGLTARELALHMAPNPVDTMDMYDILHRRLPELRDAGWLKNGAAMRTCRITKRKALTWWLFEPRPDKQLDLFDGEARP